MDREHLFEMNYNSCIKNVLFCMTSKNSEYKKRKQGHIKNHQKQSHNLLSWLYSERVYNCGQSENRNVKAQLLIILA